MVCGNLVQDILVRPVAEPLAWGTTVTVQQIVQNLGGNGGTTSYTLAKLGIPVTLLSLAGRDAAGAQLLASLKQAGVETQVEACNLPTSVSVSLVDANARRALLYQLGASAGTFTRPVTLPEDASHFHLNAIYRMRDLRGHGPQLMEQAKRLGCSTSLDTQWDHEGEWMSVLQPALRFTDLLFVNEDEARELTGLHDPAAAALALRDAGAPEVVIKLGESGCFASTSEGDFYSAAFPARAIDTTGAGDVFVGAYLAALYRGHAHREAATFANRTAAIAVGTLGATAGLDSLQFVIRP